MSVKSERRAWYAANVEPMASTDRHSDEFIAWRDRANEYMRKVCKPGSVELRDDVAPVQVAAPEPERVRVAPVRVASVAAPSSMDRAEYDAFIHGQMLAFGEHTGASGGYSDDVWRRGVTGREFGKGPLAHAWKLLNADAQEAIEAGVIRWVTFADFKAERAALRAAEAADMELQREAWEAGESCTLCLATVCECEPLEWAA